MEKYQSGLSGTTENKRLHRRKYKYNRKKAGELSVKTIQLVYEDNIKKYGTLTCYLCLNPIPFGKDHLEHKIPLSRSGTNEYNNCRLLVKSVIVANMIKLMKSTKYGGTHDFK